MKHILTLTAALVLAASAHAQVCPEPYGCSSGDPGQAVREKPTERPGPIKVEKPAASPGKPHGDKPGHGKHGGHGRK